MKPGQGKVKGGGYERTIGSRLSLWLSKGERKDLICRTVGSGAQFTYSNCGNPGDLMAQHPLAFQFFSKYCVECKFWKDLNIMHFLQGRGDLWDAWAKVNKEAKATNKLPWLVAKQNHQPDLLITLPKNIFKDHLKNSQFPNYHLLFKRTIQTYELDNFLECVDPEKYLV